MKQRDESAAAAASAAAGIARAGTQAFVRRAVMPEDFGGTRDW